MGTRTNSICATLAGLCRRPAEQPADQPAPMTEDERLGAIAAFLQLPDDEQINRADELGRLLKDDLPNSPFLVK